MPLTDAKLRVLKSKTTPFKITDAEGLYVLVAPGGSKMWRLAYRFNGKQKTLALGHYPDVSLLEARKARDAAKRLLRDGTDPSDNRKAERRKKSIAAANTFEAVADEWFDLNQGRWGSLTIPARTFVNADLRYTFKLDGQAASLRLWLENTFAQRGWDTSSAGRYLIQGSSGRHVDLRLIVDL